jgi:hypothetical protein
MPELSRFFGIIISMFYREHGPPHFHATYGEHQVAVEIESGVVNGPFPPRALQLVQEWRLIHKAELHEDWRLMTERLPLKKVAPLE